MPTVFMRHLRCDYNNTTMWPRGDISMPSYEEHLVRSTRTSWTPRAHGRQPPSTAQRQAPSTAQHQASSTVQRESPARYSVSSNYRVRRSHPSLEINRRGPADTSGESGAKRRGTPLVLYVSVVLLLFVAVILFVAFRATTSGERAGLAHMLTASVRRAADAYPIGLPDETARQRASRTGVTAALVALNAIGFLCMLFGRASLADPETLVRW